MKIILDADPHLLISLSILCEEGVCLLKRSNNLKKTGFLTPRMGNTDRIFVNVYNDCSDLSEFLGNFHMIDIPLSYENNDDLNINHNLYRNIDDDFYILIFNLNTRGLAFNKNYSDDYVNSVHSPNFFKSIEKIILVNFPNIIVIITEEELDKEILHAQSYHL